MSSDKGKARDTHTKYAPSSMKRLLACSGSAFLTPEPEAEETSYASEGTAAHDLWHFAWLVEQDPRVFRGSRIGNIKVTDAMVDGAQLFLKHVHEEMIRVDASPDNVYLEEKIFHPDDESRGGTPDAIIIGRLGVVVVDYKYGAGRLILATDPQLTEYLVLARELHRIDVDDFKAVVVQPRRANHEGFVRAVEYVGDDLDKHNEAVIQCQHAVEYGDVSFKVGNHCWKCPAMGSCDAIHHAAIQLADTFHGEKMDADRANEVMESAEAIKSYLKHTEEWEYRRLNSGGEPLQYYLRESRSQTKYDLSEDDLVIAAVKKGIDPDVLYKKKLLTVGQLKKVVDPEFVDLVASPKVGAKKLTRMNDEPDAVKQAVSAVTAFVDIPTEGFCE